MGLLMANKLEELRVYRKAVEFSTAVTALLDRAAYRKDRDLWEQTSEANDSITSNISEGFEQGTDPMFVKYLFYAKGSLGEVIARLRRARIKGHVTEAQLAAQLDAAEALSRSLGAFIRYLDACGWQDRGRHQSRLRAEARAATQGNSPKGRGTNRPEISDRGTKDEGPGTKDPGRGTKDEGPGTKDPGRGTKDEGPGTKDP
jgi:four helix bundle protein